jgi:hypothetical protein
MLGLAGGAPRASSARGSAPSQRARSSSQLPPTQGNAKAAPPVDATQQPLHAIGGAGGLDAALQALCGTDGGTARPTVLAATRSDWETVKQSASGAVREELETHLRSADTYVGKQSFLANAAAAEEAAARDARAKRAQRAGPGN